MQAMIVDVIVAFILLLFAVMAVGPFVLQIAMEASTEHPSGCGIVHLPARKTGTAVEEPAA